MPTICATTWSLSMYGHPVSVDRVAPTVDFPAPIMPTSTTRSGLLIRRGSLR